MLPLTGRRPVIAQILAMMVFSWLKVEDKGARVGRSKGIFEIHADGTVIRARHAAPEIFDLDAPDAGVASGPAF